MDTNKFETENEYKQQLEKQFFSQFFDGNWIPIPGVTKERQIRIDTNRSIIDYFGYKEKTPTYVEVKNDRIRQQHLLQIVRYYCECNEEIPIFNFYVICIKKIRPHREKVLDQLGIKILDLNDVLQEDASTWM